MHAQIDFEVLIYTQVLYMKDVGSLNESCSSFSFKILIWNVKTFVKKGSYLDYCIFFAQKKCKSNFYQKLKAHVRLHFGLDQQGLAKQHSLTQKHHQNLFTAIQNFLSFYFILTGRFVNSHPLSVRQSQIVSKLTLTEKFLT